MALTVDVFGMQEILVRSCQELGVRDNLLGCFSIRANDDIVRRALGEPFNHLEILFQRGEFDAVKNIVRGHQASITNDDFEKYSVDCAFRLGQWDQLYVFPRSHRHSIRKFHDSLR